MRYPDEIQRAYYSHIFKKFTFNWWQFSNWSKIKAKCSLDGRLAWRPEHGHRRRFNWRCLSKVSQSEVNLNWFKFLRIGYLNRQIDANLPIYQELYDIVLVQDETLDVPLHILNQLFWNQKTNAVTWAHFFSLYCSVTEVPNIYNLTYSMAIIFVGQKLA